MWCFWFNISGQTWPSLYVMVDIKLFIESNIPFSFVIVSVEPDSQV